jgi:hypothetical protein
MCDCLAWHHPVFAVAGKRLAKLGVKGGRAFAFGVFAALRDDPVLGRLSSVKDKVALLSEGFGEKPICIALAIAALQQLGVLDAAGTVVADDNGDETADEKLTKLLQHFVSAPRRGRPPLGARAMTGAERTARWAAKHPRRPGAGGPPAADENAAGIASVDPSSFSLFPDQQEHQEEQKQPRARAADETGEDFAKLRALWPLSNRMADAEREYRKALRNVTAVALLDLARHYLDTKPAWQSTMFLVNWLRTEPWRDPVLPLSAPLRTVEAGRTRRGQQLSPGSIVCAS